MRNRTITNKKGRQLPFSVAAKLRCDETVLVDAAQ